VATDPARLAALLHDFADDAVPRYRAALTEAAGGARSLATAAVDQARASRAVADRAAAAAEDQRRAVDDVAEQVAGEDVVRAELRDRARHAVEYADQTVDVVDALRRQWEHELATAHALVAELRERVEMGGRVGEDARRRLPAALERQRCCATAVERCREAAGIAAVALHQARQSTALAEQHADAVGRAEARVDDAAAYADEVEAAAEQGQRAAMDAEDAGARVRSFAREAAQRADAGASLLSAVGVRASAAADALVDFDRGGLR
jgi:hypothetical protein